MLIRILLALLYAFGRSGDARQLSRLRNLTRAPRTRRSLTNLYENQDD